MAARRAAFFAFLAARAAESRPPSAGAALSAFTAVPASAPLLLLSFSSLLSRFAFLAARRASSELAAGAGARIMIDANMGNTLNTATRMLELCADCDLYWFEEPFAEDRELNEALKMFIEENG